MNALTQTLSAYDGAPLGTSVRLSDLVLTYKGGVRAVDGLSLEVGAGEFVSLLGPSGSGKTTTLKMLAGFEDPDSGQIMVGEKSVVGVDASRRDIGMVFQNYALFPHMTVFENVAFPLKMRKRGRQEIGAAVHEALALVQMEHLADRKPGELSGGQQQRVAFARAVVFRPRLLLMDEPLGALDRQLRRDVQYELKRIQKQLGLTVVYVTHDQDEALFLSDKIAVMQGGGIAQIGAPPELYENPESRFVAEFLGDSNFLTGEIAATAEGRAEAQLPDGARVTGKLVGPAASRGGAADILIRPEKLEVVAAKDTSAFANSLDGVVEMVNFLGSQIEYEVRTGGGTIAARSYLRSTHEPLAAGKSVTLGFSSDDCMIFPVAGQQ